MIHTKAIIIQVRNGQVKKFPLCSFSEAKTCFDSFEETGDDSDSEVRLYRRDESGALKFIDTKYVEYDLHACGAAGLYCESPVFEGEGACTFEGEAFCSSDCLRHHKDEIENFWDCMGEDPHGRGWSNY